MFEGFVFRGDRGISGGAKCPRSWARVDSEFSLCGQEIIRIRLRSDLVPEHGARARFLMGTNVNTPFFEVPTPEFWHGAVPESKVSTLYSGTELGNDISGTQCLNTAPFCAGARILVLGFEV